MCRLTRKFIKFILSHQDRMTDDQFFEKAIDHLERQHRQRRVEQMRVPIDSQKS